MKMIRSSLLFVVCFPISLSVCQGQTSFGTIVGVVQDQSGRSINNAPVQVLNTATGVFTAVRTQPDGNYTAINLIPGSYVVSTEVQGFARAVTVPTQLVVNQSLRVNLVLHPGTVTQTVQVTTEGALIDTDSAAIGQEISSRQVADLPLTSGNFIGLAVLSPGVVSDPNSVIGGDQTGRSSLGGGGLYVGGGRGSSNGYLLDGVANNDPAFQTITIAPPIEDIQDVRLMNKNYSAEFGGSSAQVNIATKSGANSFHGSVYEFLQNDAMNAIPDFTAKNPVTGKYKPELRYNRFGVAAGGPVWIPHVIDGRNKLFFFANYQGVRSHSITNGRGIYPTTAELSGDFSGLPTIYEPGTKTPFPGNRITTIDPTAAKIIAADLFPTPNASLTGGYNYVATLNSPDNIDEYSVRIDAHLGQKDSLFARFSSSDENRAAPAVQPYGGTTYMQAGKNIAVDYTHIFTNNFINDLRFGLNRPISIQLQDGGGGTDNITGSFFTNTTADPIFWGAPRLSFTGYSGVGGPSIGPLNYVTTDARLTDAVTWIHGPHTVQVGLYVGKIRYKRTSALYPRGSIQTLGYYTSGSLTNSGNSIADFLLGDTFSVSVYQGGATSWFNSWGEGGFLQDNWQLSNRLTLNLGVRYDYQAPMREEFNRQSIIDTTYPGGRTLTANMAAVAEANSPLVAYTPARDITEPDKNNWSPRLGISYRPFGNTVIRTGYGIYYDSTEFNETEVQDPPFLLNYAAQDLTYFSNPIKLGTLFPAVSPTPVPGTIAGYTLYRQSRTPYVQQWNFDIEHQFPGNMVLEVGYIGSEGTHLQDRRSENQKKLITPGTAPGPVPYANFVSILEFENAASSNYHALIGRFEKRFSHGFSFLTNYTYAKALGTSSVPSALGTQASTGYMNAWDKRADYGPLGYDITQSFVFSPIWELPFGRGRRLVSNAPAVVNALIGGWQAQGIFTAHTGFPFEISATDTSGTGSPNARAQVVGNPWGAHASGLAFNTAAFAAPALYTFGNSSNNMMRGLGLNNSDFSLIKSTVIHESLNLQLRFEAFNVFNEADVGPYPGYALATTSNFGIYTTVQKGARTLQIAAKINF
jgi:Carboxypeptidase regulatory-like domain